MSEPSEAAYKRAGEIYKGESQSNVTATCDEAVWHAAFARVLQEHSDVAKACLEAGVKLKTAHSLNSLILPDDSVTDQFTAAVLASVPTTTSCVSRTEIRAAIEEAAAGYQITRKGD